MKKALALMLTAAMTAALLVGCSGSKPAETTAAAAAAPAATTAAAAQAAPAAPAAPAYPTKDIQIIVPYAPGGGSDNLVRGMIQYLDLDGKTAVPINVEGASGYIGALQAYNTANDGYTILTHNEMDVISYVVSGQAEVDLVGDQAVDDGCDSGHVSRCVLVVEAHLVLSESIGDGVLKALCGRIQCDMLHELADSDVVCCLLSGFLRRASCEYYCLAHEKCQADDSCFLHFHTPVFESFSIL